MLVNRRPFWITLLLLFGSPTTALGYCRTRTCATDHSCEIGEDGCTVGGKPVKWPSGCLNFSMQRDGSPLQDISAEAALDVAVDAFSLWTDSKCFTGGTPPLTFSVLGDVQCHVPEYNCGPGDWNANVIMFQDEGWQHGSASLAVTCVTMNVDTGEILDADMEINTTPPYYDFGLPGEVTGADLHTVITHEAGHFLGLDHSPRRGAVMFASYDDSVLLSSLSDDDIAGVCDIYGGTEQDPKCKDKELPEDTSCVGNSECEPVSRKSSGCSCRLRAPCSGSSGSGPLGLVVIGFFGWLARRGLAGSRRRTQAHSRAPTEW